MRPEPIDAPWAPQKAAHNDDTVPLHPVLQDFERRLGKTPLVEVPSHPGGARILAKCEWHNPYGSIKDRVAFALIRDALARHGARPLDELRVLEYSGGNLARGLSHLTAALGIRARFVLSEASPSSLLTTLRENGSEIVLVAKDSGFLGVVEHTLDLARRDADWTLLYQHRNPANLDFHRTTTGAEVVQQLAGQAPTHWVASVGTGGTLIGVHHALTEQFPDVQAVAVTPAELPYGSFEPPNGRPKIAGSGGLGWGKLQPFVANAPLQIDERTVARPHALELMGDFLHETGTRIGTSAAANWYVAKDVAKDLPPAAVVVTVFPCAGTPEEWALVNA